MLVDRMVSSIHFDTEEITQEQWNKIDIKFATIEERISMQIKNAIIDYISERIDIEDSKKKPKPYYRKGRWE